MSKPIIQVEGIGKSYKISHELKASVGNVSIRDGINNIVRKPIELITGHRMRQEKFWALKDINFEVEQGEVLGIIGKNGSGKSTLLKVMSRITEPTKGEIRMHGRVASLLEVGTGFHPELTGRENIYFNGSILGMRKKEIESKFDEIVAFSEVEKFLDTPVKFYSSGMYVRLAFAVAAHLDPDILIIDEVLAVGDTAFQKKCLGKMKDVAGQGRTVMFVSHSMNSVQQLCNSGIFLQDGQIVAAEKDVSKVIDKYMSSNGTNGVGYKWTNKNGMKSDYFIPDKMTLLDANGSTINETVSKDDKVSLSIDGEIIKTDPDLTIGCAIYAEDGSLLYWSYPQDMQKERSNVFKLGKVSFSTQLPLDQLNLGTYKIELIAGLHYRSWLFEPGVNSPNIRLDISGKPSDSAYWIEKRPGYMAPISKWVIEQSNNV